MGEPCGVEEVDNFSPPWSSVTCVNGRVVTMFAFFFLFLSSFFFFCFLSFPPQPSFFMEQ